MECHPAVSSTKEEALSRFSEWCAFALMAEVDTTPKPGLVDRCDNGAHQDMDYYTFTASTEAIVPFMDKMFLLGYSWSSNDLSMLFHMLRQIGKEAENAMFAATGGVNTHKGMIFSMGAVSAAAGLFYRHHGTFHPEEILLLTGQLCHDVIEADFKRIDRRNPRTHGELLYLRYGAKGIRGEVQQGFPSIRTASLPALRAQRAKCADDNEAYLNTLLALMATVDDTNVLIRTSTLMQNVVKTSARQILEMGGASSTRGMEALRQLNTKFIQLNISPGGCADLLAVTILLETLERAVTEAPGIPAARFHETLLQSRLL